MSDLDIQYKRCVFCRFYRVCRRDLDDLTACIRNEPPDVEDTIKAYLSDIYDNLAGR
jgi:hypothetical protein